ncbi:MAG: hypothetical protein WKF50_12200 [Nocardioides sp.]
MSARSRIAVLAILPSLVTGAVVSTVVPSYADTPGCVTKAEYKSVKKGMKMGKVHGILDTVGHQESKATSGGYVFLIRSYKVCSAPYSSVVMGFEKSPGTTLKMSNKTAVWVS